MPESPLRIAQFTDLHLLGATDGRLRGIATYATAGLVIGHARRHGRRWDAFLLTGDLVHDDPLGYAHLRPLLGTDPPVTYCIPGNHDSADGMRAALAGEPFRINGSARHGGWLLVMLDSTVAGAAHGRIAGPELERLDHALADNPDLHALVCLHHHAVPAGSRWLDALGLENATELFGVIDRHPQVRALVWGHVHQAWEGTRNGVRLMSAPATCVQFEPGADDFAIDDRPPGYRWFDLHADGGIDTGIEWVDDATADTPAADQGLD